MSRVRRLCQLLTVPGTSVPTLLVVIKRHGAGRSKFGLASLALMDQGSLAFELAAVDVEVLAGA